PPHAAALFPYTPLFRSWRRADRVGLSAGFVGRAAQVAGFTRSSPSCTTVATSVPSRVNSRPVASPRAPEADGEAWSYSSHWSARSEEHTSELQSRGHLV